MNGMIGIIPDSGLMKLLGERIEKSALHDHLYSLNMDHCGFVTYGFADNPNKPEAFAIGDTTIIISICGYIYNQDELLKRPSASIKSKNSPSMNELVVMLWKEFGTNFFREIDGNFAISIYDTKTQDLILASDRLGTIDIYYKKIDNNFIYSTEMKWLLANDSDKKLDTEVLLQFFTLGYPTGNRNLISSIKLLEPASILKLTKESIEIKQYFSYSEYCVSYPKLNENEYAELICHLTIEAVGKRLNHSKKACVTLSGGLDSRMILAALCKNGAKPKAYTFGSDKSDDVIVAKKVIQKIRCSHSIINYDTHAFYKNMSLMSWISEGLSSTPQYFLLSQFINSGSIPTFWGFLGDILSGSLLKDHSIIPLTFEQLRDFAFFNISFFPNKGLHLEGNFFREKYRPLVKETFDQLIRKYTLNSDKFDERTGESLGLQLMLFERNRRIIKNVLLMGRFYSNPALPFTDSKIIELYMSMPLKFRIGQSAYKKAVLSIAPELRGIRLAKRDFSLSVDRRLTKYYYYRNKIGSPLINQYYRYLKYFVPKLQAQITQSDFYNPKRCKIVEQKVLKNEFIHQYLNIPKIKKMFREQAAGCKNNISIINKLVAFDLFCDIYLINDPSLFFK